LAGVLQGTFLYGAYCNQSSGVISSGDFLPLYSEDEQKVFFNSPYPDEYDLVISRTDPFEESNRFSTSSEDSLPPFSIRLEESFGFYLQEKFNLRDSLGGSKQLKVKGLSKADQKCKVFKQKISSNLFGEDLFSMVDLPPSGDYNFPDFFTFTTFLKKSEGKKEELLQTNKLRAERISSHGKLSTKYKEYSSDPISKDFIGEVFSKKYIEEYKISLGQVSSFDNENVFRISAVLLYLSSSDYIATTTPGEDSFLLVLPDFFRILRGEVTKVDEFIESVIKLAKKRGESGLAVEKIIASYFYKKLYPFAMEEEFPSMTHHLSRLELLDPEKASEIILSLATTITGKDFSYTIFRDV